MALKILPRALITYFEAWLGYKTDASNIWCVPVFTGDIWGHLATMKEVFIAFDFTMADFLESKYEWESVGQ